MTSTNRRPTLFISYRRDDASTSAGRLCDWLTRQFGRERVFLDTDRIAAGDDFVRKLDERLATSDVLLAVIGPRWLDIADARGRRLDQPDDFVRMEVATAMARGIRVIPVLVGGARMPSAESLPEVLREMWKKNAASLDDARFERDFNALVDDILQRPRGYLNRELDRLARLLRALKLTSLLVPALALGLVLAAWVSLLAPLGLDARVRNLLLWTADEIAPLPEDPGVLLVALDDASQAALGPPDFGPNAHWRKLHTQLIDRAASAGAAALVFDLAFTTPTAADGELAEAVRRARSGPADTHVVFGAHGLDGEAAALVSIFGEAASGNTCLMRTGGGYAVPMAVLAHQDRDDAMVAARRPALSLAAAHTGAPVEVDIERRTIRLEGRQASRMPRFSTVERNRSDTCAALRPGEDVAVLLIRASAPDYWKDPARRVSYADALRTLPTERLAGRVLLVGIALRESRDRHVLKRGWSHRTVYGVELHAEAIATLLAGRETVLPTVDFAVLLLFAAGMAGAAIGFFAAPLSTWLRRLTTSAVVALYIVVAVAAAANGLLLQAPYDLTAFVVAWAVVRRLQRKEITP